MRVAPLRASVAGAGAIRIAILVAIAIATSVVTAAGCDPPNALPVAAPMTPAATGRAPVPVDRAAPAIAIDGTSGELRTTGAVTFEVRPSSGPGTMGPRVLSAASAVPLEELRAYLAAHPDVGPLRVECAANPRMMSGMPTPRWPAGLASQVARWLVEHGIDCKRLDVVGWLDATQEAPGERVHFFVGPRAAGAARPPASEARLDACSTGGD